MRAVVLFFILTLMMSCQNKREITVTKKADVMALAGDELSGRETGTLGEIKASQYIVKRFVDIGLLKKGSKGYFQEFAFKPSANPHEQTFISDSLLVDGTLTGRNVIGYIDNKGEHTVVIGAHYDHLGLGGDGSLHRGENEVHNGADDNASGVAVLLDLAQQLSQIDSQNNYLFIAFSGEEMGLYGSSFWVKNPTVELKSVSYMINMDMVGRLNDEHTLAVHGVGTSPIFKQTLFANNDQDLSIAEFESGVGPSDHTSFYVAGIPVLHFFTGQHEDYHKPSDDFEKLNYEGMDRISNYILNIVQDLDDTGKLTFKKTKNESEEVPAFKVGLGVVPDYLFTGEGMRIDGVSEDKPAQMAGLKRGDIVKQLDTMQVKDLMTYMKALSTFDNGDTSLIIVEREGELLEVEVTF